MRQRSKNLALFVGVLLALDVGLAQIGKLTLDTWYIRGPERRYRIPSEIYHHDLAKNASVRATWGGIRYPYYTNSLGFRDEVVRGVPLRGSAARLLFIGDSFTEGVGVPYDQTFVGILAGWLAGRGIEVLNAAVSSYSPAIYYRKLKYLIEEVGLDVHAVVVCLDVSDILDEAEYYRLDDRERVIGTGPPDQPPSAARRVKELLKHNSVIANTTSRLKLVLERALEKDEPQALGLEAEEARWAVDERVFADYGAVGLQRAQANMDRLMDLLRRHHVETALVVYPWPDQIMLGDLNSRQVTFWRDWAERNGVTFINLFPLFISPEQDPLRTIHANFIPFDFHWNAQGHRRVAEALLAAGVAQLPSPTPQPGAKAKAGGDARPTVRAIGLRVDAAPGDPAGRESAKGRSGARSRSALQPGG